MFYRALLRSSAHNEIVSKLLFRETAAEDKLKIIVLGSVLLPRTSGNREGSNATGLREVSGRE